MALAGNVLVSLLLSTPAGAEAASLPVVEGKGARLLAGGRPFRAYGFNHMFQEHPSIDYIAKPTSTGLRRVRADFSKARRLGDSYRGTSGMR